MRSTTTSTAVPCHKDERETNNLNKDQEHERNFLHGISGPRYGRISYRWTLQDPHCRARKTIHGSKGQGAVDVSVSAPKDLQVARVGGSGPPPWIRIEDLSLITLRNQVLEKFSGTVVVALVLRDWGSCKAPCRRKRYLHPVGARRHPSVLFISTTISSLLIFPHNLVAWFGLEQILPWVLLRLDSVRERKYLLR